MPTDIPVLHAVIWACAIAAFAVFAVMLHSIATFRRDAGTRTRSASAEFFWALIPIIIVVAMAAPAISTQVGPRDTDATALQARDQAGPELAVELPRKAFHEGGIPL